MRLWRALSSCSELQQLTLGPLATMDTAAQHAAVGGELTPCFPALRALNVHDWANHAHLAAALAPQLSHLTVSCALPWTALQATTLGARSAVIADHAFASAESTANTATASSSGTTRPAQSQPPPPPPPLLAILGSANTLTELELPCGRLSQDLVQVLAGSCRHLRRLVVGGLQDELADAGNPLPDISLPLQELRFTACVDAGSLLGLLRLTPALQRLELCGLVLSMGRSREAPLQLEGTACMLAAELSRAGLEVAWRDGCVWLHVRPSDGLAHDVDAAPGDDENGGDSQFGGPEELLQGVDGWEAGEEVGAWRCAVSRGVAARIAAGVPSVHRAISALLSAAGAGSSRAPSSSPITTSQPLTHQLSQVPTASSPVPHALDLTASGIVLPACSGAMLRQMASALPHLGELRLGIDELLPSFWAALTECGVLPCLRLLHVSGVTWVGELAAKEALTGVGACARRPALCIRVSSYSPAVRAAVGRIATAAAAARDSATLGSNAGASGRSMPMGVYLDVM